MGWEDSLEKEIATHYSILIWEIPRNRSLASYSLLGLKRVRHDLAKKQEQKDKMVNNM